jgi:hypothetical protein
LVSAIAIAMGLVIVGGCTSFSPVRAGPDAATESGAAEGGGTEAGVITPEGGVATSDAGGGVACGANIVCVPPDVCCFNADAGTGACTMKGTCDLASLACDDTADCVAANATPGAVCCAYLTLAGQQYSLRESKCVQPSSCDPDLPEDQLCDPELAERAECKDDRFPACKSYVLGPPGLAACAPK